MQYLGLEKLTEDRIDNLALKVLDKKTYYCELAQVILYKAFRNMVPQEAAKVIETLKDKIKTLTITRVGTLLTLDLIAFANARERKVILRQIKEVVPDIIQWRDKRTIYPLLKLLLEMDDVVVVNRLILNTIKPLISQLYNIKENGPIIQVLLTVFTGQSKNLLQFDKNPTKHTTSKKDAETKKQQLGTFMLDTVVKSLQQNLLLAQTNSHIVRLLFAVMHFILKYQKEEHYYFVKYVWEQTKQNFKEKIEDLQENDITFKLGHPVTHRLFKELIIKEKELRGNQVYSDMVKEIYKLVKKNIKKLLSTRIIFLVIGFIEGDTKYKEKLLKKMLKVEKQLQSLNSFNGVRIVLKHLKTYKNKK